MSNTYSYYRRTFDTNQIRLPHHPRAFEGFRTAGGSPLHPSVWWAQDPVYLGNH